MDGELKAVIATILQNDDILLDVLPQNLNWLDNDQDDSHSKWSIVPLEKFAPINPLPQITIQSGGDTRIGTNLYEDIMYVRCYNSSSKTFVDITKILARVKQLLHKRAVKLAGSTSVELVYETTSAELIDQGLGELPFRESRYSWQRI